MIALIERLMAWSWEKDYRTWECHALIGEVVTLLGILAALALVFVIRVAFGVQLPSIVVAFSGVAAWAWVSGVYLGRDEAGLWGWKGLTPKQRLDVVMDVLTPAVFGGLVVLLWFV